MGLSVTSRPWSQITYVFPISNFKDHDKKCRAESGEMGRSEFARLAPKLVYFGMRVLADVHKI